MTKILIIEDDEELTFILGQFMQNAGFDTELVYSGEKAIEVLTKDSENIDLVIVDLVMPNVDGIEVITYIRENPKTKPLPILVLTGQADIYNKSRSFNAGADDYLVKPVEYVEFMLRVKALLRRGKLNKELVEKKEAGNRIEIDKNTSTLKVNNQTVYLTSTEFKILTYLIQKDPEPVSTEELLEEILNYPKGTGNPVTIRTHIRNIRAKVEDDSDNPQILITIPKRGYILNKEYIYNEY